MKVWLSAAEFAAVDAAACEAGVETGAVCREAIVRAATSVARDAAAGRLRLRRRSGAVPSRVSMATTAVVEDLGPRDAPVQVPVSGVERADLFRRMTERRS